VAEDIAQWLENLGLGQYAQAFADNGIDIEALPHLRDEDFERLGVLLGHMRRLQAAIETLSADEPPTRPTPRPSKEPEPRPAEAERRQLTVMFCDLVGSTELSQRLDPEDMRDLLRTYQNAVSGEVARFDGHIAKFMGEPKAHEDQAERAVHAALGVAAAVRQLRLPDNVKLDVRVGIASGRVVVGDLLGEGAAEEAAVTGETPNLAARLQEVALPGQIAICGATQRLIGSAFELKDLGRSSFKGYAEPLPVWRVISESRVESRYEAAHGGSGALPMVGRTHELGLLLDRWERVKTGEGQVVLVSGEAGIGKSRLVSALREKIAEEKHFRLRYQGSPYHTNSALHPMIARMERAAQFGAEDSTETKLDKLEQLLQLSGLEIDEHMAIFASLLSLPPPGPYRVEELTPEQHKERTLMALIDQLLALARMRPVLFVYEDAHWMDPTTRELMTRIVARITAVPVLMVITHRTEWSQDWVAELGHVSSLALTRLASSDAAEFVETVAGTALAPELVERIATRTDGIPLFIEELTRSFLEAGSDTLEFVRDIPDTLQGLLQARLDRLDPEVREAVQIGAVIGREFRLDLVTRVVQQPGNLQRTLDRLAASQLVLPSGSAAQPSYVFRHGLMQDTAYNSLLMRRRRKYHCEIARLLEELSPETADLAPELIAQHFTAAALPDEAIPYWLRAGKRALERWANAEAVEHLLQGIALIAELPKGPDRLRLQLDFCLNLGDAQNRAARLQESIRSYNQAARLARLAKSPADLIRAALGFEQSEFYLNQEEEASILLLEEALSAVGEGDSVERCSLLGRLGRAHCTVASPERALDVTREAIAMARRLGDKRALCDALIMNYYSTVGGQPAEAQRAVKELYDLAVEIGDSDLIMQAESWQLYNYAQLGDLEGLDAASAAYAQLAAKHQLPLHIWVSTSAKAMNAILHGKFEEAEQIADEALQLGHCGGRSRI
jgi:class 3 adenylate cyclase/tetratricopeptide (TPR) repeat protein/(2Fe-2S) ferredoxin